MKTPSVKTGLFKNLLIFFLVLLIVSGLFSVFQKDQDPNSIKRIPLSQIIQDIEDNKIKQILVKGDELEIEYFGGIFKRSKKEPEIALSETLKNYGINPRQANIDPADPTGWEFWLGVLAPILLPFLFIAIFILFMMRGAKRVNMQAMGFGRSLARMVRPEKDKNGNKKGITFKDVAGLKEPKEELQEVVQFLKSPKKFTNLGAKIPKGVLLVGPPGCGKTLLAKAVANEAEVPFFNISGSEFVEMFVGVGASRVRSTFQEAKKHSPAILFIDELDAIGRYRGAGLGGGHDEREQTLNQILVEMDGFEPETGVIVLAATNRPDVLDPALLRPGRFDRRIVLNLPDIKEREEILKIHSKKKPLEKKSSLHNIAQRTPGFSGADLANLINEAAILSARKGKKKIELSELREAIEKVLLGPERKSRVMSKKEKKIIAYHEAGHAAVASYLKNVDPVQKVTIIPRGQAGGYTLKTPIKDKSLRSRLEFKDELAVLLAGYAAEKIIFKDITTGAASDLAEATSLARKMVVEYGMSRLGPVHFKDKEEMIFLGRELSSQKDFSEKTSEAIDKEIARLVQEGYTRASNTIFKQKNVLEKIAKKLIAKEVIEKEEFEGLLRP